MQFPKWNHNIVLYKTTDIHKFFLILSNSTNVYSSPTFKKGLQGNYKKGPDKNKNQTIQQN